MTELDDARSAAGQGFIDLLREDHRQILHLFDRVAECDTREMDPLLSLFHRIEEELQRHLEGEERFLYTALERHETARQLVLEEYELHRLATFTIGTFKTLALDDERWRPKVRVLRRLVEEHIRSQEHDLFPLALEILDAKEMRGIAERFVGVRSGSDRRAGFDAPK